ncbi:MAG: TonB-dependent receptor, partial [Acidobacteria bacterium]|nr:TonB-dependent receptor [Acidobacteriota bacterium]
IGMFNKLSFVRSPTMQGNVTWLYTPGKATGTLPAFDGPGSKWMTSSRAANDANAARGFFAPQSSYSITVNYTPINNIAVDARGGFFWDNYKDTGIAEASSVTYQTSSVGLSFVPPNLQGPAGTRNFAAAQRTRFDLFKRLTGQVDVTYIGEAHGQHRLKGGYGIQWLGNNVDISYPGGGYILVHWDRSFTSLITGNTDRGQYGYYEINQRGTIGTLSVVGQQAFYANDEWQITPRLTLNLGARFERETIPAFDNASLSLRNYRLTFTWQDKAAPRFGASFDLFGDGGTKLYGSWGRFYDRTKYTLMRGPFGGDIWTIRYRSLDTLNVFSLGGGNLPGRDLWNPSVPDSFRSRTIPSFGGDTVDPSLRPASQDTISLGVEHEWRRNQIFGVRYLHQNLRRTIEDLIGVVRGEDMLIYANPGEGLAEQVTFITGLTAPFPYPKPSRRYDAVEFTFSKRPSIGWFGDFSYTWSRLFGNYAGIANSDDIRTPTTGVSHVTSQQQEGSIARPGSYANSNWDLDEIMFDSLGKLDPEGLLATGRTHVFKFKGGYEFGWGAEVGGFVYAGSGTPLSTKVLTTNFLPVLVEGRGDMGRTPTLAYADLLLAHTIRIDDVRGVRFEFNLLNAFNSKTSRHRFEHLNRGAGVPRASSAIDLSRVDLRRGYNYRAFIAATPDGTNAFDPRYNMDDLFNAGFSARLGIKFVF